MQQEQDDTMDKVAHRPMSPTPTSGHGAALEVRQQRRTLLGHALEKPLLSRAHDMEGLAALLLCTLDGSASLLATDNTALRRIEAEVGPKVKTRVSGSVEREKSK